MSPGVFDAGKAERLRERINQDGAFHQVSQDMTLNLALEIDGAARLVAFRDGTLTSIRPFVTVTEPVDVTIRGDTTFWRNLLSPVPPPRFQNLYAGVRAETCQVSGNAELYWAYFAALINQFSPLFERGDGRRLVGVVDRPFSRWEKGGLAFRRAFFSSDRGS